MTVRRFPVNENRDVGTFLRVQEMISRGQELTDDEEDAWLRQSVNSDTLIAHLRENGPGYARVIAGPYLFGLVEAACMEVPDKMLLVPCLHDEPFARVRRIRKMFEAVLGFLFNTEPEQALAHRLYNLWPKTEAVVAMGIEPFEGDPNQMVDDPTTGGQITARMLRLYQQTIAAFPDTSWACYSPHRGRWTCRRR